MATVPPDTQRELHGAPSRETSPAEPATLYIAGGTYVEFCDEPHWDQLFGSGLRAAAAVGSLGCDVIFSTYVGADHADDLDVYADTFGIQTRKELIERTIRFAYSHPLARPEITPPLHLLRQATPVTVEGKAVLRFGMLEGTAVVTGGRVVYDPQSTYDPVPFDANGSRAEELAVVANRWEAEQLTGKSTVEAMGQALLNWPGGTVAIIKRGARGLSVFVRDAGGEIIERSLPAYETRQVWPIGSGDVFSAVFAHWWAAKCVDPFAAAERASRATACYCGSRQLQMLEAPYDALGYELKPLRPESDGDRPLVYLAGPFFTMEQRWLVREARGALFGQGVQVFSPFHDVGLGAAEEVVSQDIDALDRCKAVLALIDGGDTGTIFEVGYARAKNIPVIALAESEAEEPLKMLRGTGCEVQADFTTAVYRAAWAAARAIQTSAESRPCMAGNAS